MIWAYPLLHNTYVIFVKVAWMIGMCSNCHVRHNFFSFFIYSYGCGWNITSHYTKEIDCRTVCLMVFFFAKKSQFLMAGIVFEICALLYRKGTENFFLDVKIILLVNYI